MRFKTTELMVSIIPPKGRKKPVPDGDPPVCKDATSWCFGNSMCAAGTHQCGLGTDCINGSGPDLMAACKTGGSTWCTGDSSGCKNGTNCAGTSTKLSDGRLVGECKSGGSTWCEGDSSGCAAGTHCVTGTHEPDLEGHVRLTYDPDEMKALRSQLALMLKVKNAKAFTQFTDMLENPNATLNIRLKGAGKPASSMKKGAERKAK